MNRDGEIYINTESISSYVTYICHCIFLWHLPVIFSSSCDIYLWPSHLVTFTCDLLIILCHFPVTFSSSCDIYLWLCHHLVTFAGDLLIILWHLPMTFSSSCNIYLWPHHLVTFTCDLLIILWHLPATFSSSCDIYQWHSHLATFTCDPSSSCDIYLWPHHLVTFTCDLLIILWHCSHQQCSLILCSVPWRWHNWGKEYNHHRDCCTDARNCRGCGGQYLSNGNLSGSEWSIYLLRTARCGSNSKGALQCKYNIWFVYTSSSLPLQIGKVCLSVCL